MMRRGDRGESMAGQYLAGKGYEPVERNYRCRFGEIDIICRDGDYIVFVEVKLRKSVAFGSPAEAVTPAKRRKLRIAAEMWLAESGCALFPRFDVVAILAPQGPDGEVTVDHIVNAF